MSTPAIKSCTEVPQQPVLPDANGYTWIYDSTNQGKMEFSGLTKTAAVPSPGPDRGGAKNKRIMLTAGCTGQNVTLLLYRLTGAAAWALYNSVTIVAGDTPQGVDWSVLAPDCMIGFLGGATPPDAITTTVLVTEQP